MRDEEKAGKELLEEVQERRVQWEDEMWEPEKSRSGSLNAQIWQLVQSRNTQAENLENGFNEIIAKIQEFAWRDG